LTGMLYRDRRQLLLWMAIGFCIMALLYPAGMGSRFSQLVYSFLMQVVAMVPVRTLVQEDRVSGWKMHIALQPEGRRWYAAEKYLLVLCMLPALLAGAFVGCQVYHLGLYGEWVGELYLPRDTFTFVYFFLMMGLQMPVLLLFFNRVSLYWESFTWLVSFPFLLWLDNGRIAAYQTALLQGTTPAAMDALEYHRWYEYDWDMILRWAVVFFLVSAAVTVWLAGYVRGRGLFEKRQARSALGQFFMENGKRALVFCGITAVLLAVLWTLDAHTPQKDIYIYEKPHWKGGVSYLVTTGEPAYVAERFPAEDFTHIGTYMAYNAYGEVFDGIDGTFLVWDNDWFLWDMETGAKTPVSLPEDPSVVEVQLLDSTEPAVVALLKRYDDPDGTRAASGFFSIKENRMITDFIYGSWGDDLIDGMIAAEDADGGWVLIDPVTGEITGTLPGRP